LGPAPQPEGHGDVARRHRVPQILAELHPKMLRRQRARAVPADAPGSARPPKSRADHVP
jgi:hypothetical protein